MKELINYLSSPMYSFTGFVFMFAMMIKYYQTVGTKKFAWIGTLVLILIATFFMMDPSFRGVITTPDNIPIIILLITVIFFTWFSLYQAANNDERIAKGLEPLEGTPENREKVWAWPNLVYTELFVIILGTVFLIAWAIFFKAPLEEPANPTWAPNPAKAPWYFLGLQEMLVYFDPWIAGVVLPGIVLVGLILIPFIDFNPKGNGYYCFKERKFAITMFLFGWLALWVFLIIVGTFLRGPNWTFYGPFEVWDVHKVVAENNINLSEIMWIKLFNTRVPSNIFIREIFGIIFLGLYFVASVPIITKLWGQKFLEKMGAIRYYILIFLVLSMSFLPLKMYLRWFFTLKYIMAMPEFELNV